MILPMLAKDTRGDTSVVPRDWVMEPKLDGWRWLTVVGDGNVRCFGGRNGSEHAPPPVVQTACESLPPGTTLDGELIPLDRTQKSPWVNHLLAHGGDGLGYVIFDTPVFNGIDLTHAPWTYRRTWLETLELTHPVVLNPYRSFDPDVVTQWVDLGFEGAVCKNPRSVYRAGKRSGDWLKIKPQLTDDAIVTGWQHGKGASNTHLCGCLEIRMTDTDVETTTAFKATPEEAEKMIGRLIEIRHHGLMKSGKPRHPIFSRTRDDLEPVNSPAPKPEGPPVRKAQPTTRPSGASNRNYTAMGSPKLLQCRRELAAGEGGAFDKCVLNGGLPEADLANIDSILAARGLVV